MHDDIVSPEQRARGAMFEDAPAPMIGGRSRRPIVIVLGMHRSGTSLCAHVLSALGVDMSDDIDIAPSNARGHWERRSIVELHDRILRILDREYYSPFHDLPLPVAWWADPEVAKIRREIMVVLRKAPDSAWFGIKDPRLVRLMPLWHQIFGETKLAPRFVLCLRNPAEVARSLAVRDGLDPELGEYRWFSYMVDAFQYTKGHDICVVEYESWFGDAARNIATLQNFLDLPRLQGEFDLDLTISGIVDDRLRHDERPGRESGQPLVRALYGLARRAEQDAAAREEIQRIAAEFSRVQLLQRGFYRAFERTAALAGEREKIGEERDRLAGELAAAVAERETLAGEHGRIADELNSAREERDRLAGELAAAVAERETLAGEHGRIADELNSAREERDRLAAERDAAAVYRKLLLRSLDDITNERDAARAELDKVTNERDAAQAELDDVTGERDMAQAETAERDRVVNVLTEELFRVVREQVAEDLGMRRRPLITRLPFGMSKRAPVRRATASPM